MRGLVDTRSSSEYFEAIVENRHSRRAVFFGLFAWFANAGVVFFLWHLGRRLDDALFRWVRLLESFRESAYYGYSLRRD